jgi:hypothetical protein
VSRVVIALLAVVCWPSVATAQTEAEPPPPAIRRWLDVQTLQLSSRFRWVRANDGRITSSTHQLQPTVRARVLFDQAARYSLHVGAFGGSQFVSGWNNTGAGLGEFAGDFNIKQLFLAAEPVPGLEFQAGGLYFVRGENTEITSYDNDAFVVGERVTVRRPRGVLSQLVATIGHIGDYRTPGVFARLDTMVDFNYGQLLIGARVGPRVNLSADYTYEDGRDILREGLMVRVPDAARPLTALRVEAYQRVSDEAGQGFNVGGDLRLSRAFTVTAGFAHVDRGYLIPGFTSPNADRFERGTRFYSQGTYALTKDLSIGWFQGEALGVDYPIPNEHRWEVLLTINPTATLKAHRVF